MEALSDTLTQHIDDVIESHHHEKILTTTGTRTAVFELLERTEGLERAVGELALEVQRLGARLDHIADR